MISIEPTGIRFVDIHHTDWDLHWAIQLPEGISSARGTSMTWTPIHPEWMQRSDQAWHYDWRTTQEYIDNLPDYMGESNYVIGLALKAEIEAVENELRLVLTITNESPARLENVICDGGCLQARNEQFTDDDEVGRSRVMMGCTMVDMATLHRTIPERVTYALDDKTYEEGGLKDWEWFWGRSSDYVDAPVIVGAVSRDGAKALAIGYENARTGSQNADAHHCLHSRPHFGDIAPGESVTRRGYVVFGDDIEKIAADLKQRICG